MKKMTNQGAAGEKKCDEKKDDIAKYANKKRMETTKVFLKNCIIISEIVLRDIVNIN
jgi:hypothetical protein